MLRAVQVKVMGTPEEKARKRMRMRKHVQKDLKPEKSQSKKARKRELERLNKPVDVSKLSHAEFVSLISEKEES